jgi:hypothetical protein
MPSTVAIIQIDDSSDKTIHGIWQFDKSLGGTIVLPFVTGALPASGMTHEVIISGTYMYTWDGVAWVPLQTVCPAGADPNAQYLVLSSSTFNPNERVLVLGTGLSGSDGGPTSVFSASVDFRQTSFVNDTGPFELLAQAESAYKVTQNTVFPLTVSWYADAGHTTLLQRKTMVRNAQQNPTTINWFLYEADGVSLRRQYQETITYTGVNETNRIRTRIL